MNITDDISFDEWFDLFKDKLADLAYFGPVDKYSFEDEYESGKTPNLAAVEFVVEMRS